MKSLSVGVRSVFSDVNWRSKFDTSLRCFCWRNLIKSSNALCKLKEKLTIFGLNGGWTSRFSIFSQSIRRKKVWFRTSSSPVELHPNLFCGFFVRNWVKVDLIKQTLSKFKVKLNSLLYKHLLPLYSSSSDMKHCGQWWLQTTLPHLLHQTAVAQSAFRKAKRHMPTNQLIYRKADTKLSAMDMKIKLIRL